MDEPTVVVIPGQPESEPPSESMTEDLTETDAAVEDVATVADEILVEVKECRTRLDQSTADLERLQSEGGPAKTELVRELLTEIKTCRMEYQSLLNELKDLRREQADSRSSIPSTSPLTPEAMPAPIVEPEDEGGPVAPANEPKRKKRYRI